VNAVTTSARAVSRSATLATEARALRRARPFTGAKGGDGQLTALALARNAERMLTEAKVLAGGVGAW